MSFAAPPVYRGAPVLDELPDWSDPSPALSLHQMKARLDGGAGPITDDSPSVLRPRTARRLRYLLETRADVLAARTFLRTVAMGRWAGFWVPTWAEDLRLAAPVAAIDVTVAVTRIGVDRFYPFTDATLGPLGRQHLAFFPQVVGAAPAAVCRKITGVATVGETDVLTIDAALGAAFTVNDLLSFLLFSRADADRLLVQWETTDVGLLELSLIDLPRETP